MDEFPIRHPQQLSSLLKALRHQTGLSQAAVAARLGVSHQAISALEKQPDKATVERLMRVLSILEIDLVLRPAKRTPPNDKPEW